MASAAARKKTSAGMSDKTSDIILVAICAIALIIVAYPLSTFPMFPRPPRAF